VTAVLESSARSGTSTDGGSVSSLSAAIGFDCWHPETSVDAAEPKHSEATIITQEAYEFFMMSQSP
jgi:hypothetical protein